MQRIGRLSYSWYLWHWPVLVYAAALGATGSLGWRIAWAALSLLLAHLTFRTVEDPVRHHRALLRPRLTAVTAVILTLSTVGCSQWWLSSAARAADRPDQRMFTTAYTDLPENYTRGCHVDVLSVEGQPCVFGDTAAEETVVLFGDSHAAQWLPAVERLAKTEGWRVLSLTKSECPAAAVELYSPRLGRRYDECTRWHRRTLQRIVELRPALVLASSSRAYPAADAHSPYRVTHAEWQEGTRRLVETLTSAGVRTVLIRDTPRPGIVIPTCLARASWSLLRRPGECQVSRDVAVDTIVSSLERAAIAGIDGAEIADLTDAICDEATCAPTQDGVVVFKDSNHLTAAFSRMMAPALGDALRGRGERITRHGQRSEAG